MILRKYLSESCFTVREFAEICGVNESHISRISMGHYRPGKKLARLIEEKTDGEVKACDLRKFPKPAEEKLFREQRKKGGCFEKE